MDRQRAERTGIALGELPDDECGEIGDVRMTQTCEQRPQQVRRQVGGRQRGHRAVGEAVHRPGVAAPRAGCERDRIEERWVEPRRHVRHGARDLLRVVEAEAEPLFEEAPRGLRGAREGQQRLPCLHLEHRGGATVALGPLTEQADDIGVTAVVLGQQAGVEEVFLAAGDELRQRCGAVLRECERLREADLGALCAGRAERQEQGERSEDADRGHLHGRGFRGRTAQVTGPRAVRQGRNAPGRAGFAGFRKRSPSARGYLPSSAIACSRRRGR